MKNAALIAFAGCLLVASLGSAAETMRDLIIKQSYEEAFGSDPTAAEVKYWEGRQDWKSKGDLVNFHRQGIKTNPTLVDKIVTNSYAKAFGRAPVQGEWNFWRPAIKQNGNTYTEVLAAHEKWKQTVPVQAKASPKISASLVKAGLKIDASNNVVKVASPAQVVAHAGSYLIGHDGSSLIGHDGSSIVGTGAGN